MKATTLIKDLQTEIEKHGDKDILFKLKSNTTGGVITTHDLNDSIGNIISNSKEYIQIKAYAKNFKEVR